jgi:tRNA-binding protein
VSAPQKPPIAPDAFLASDLRVGLVVAVEAFPEADPPAWKIQVDFGPELGCRWTSARVTSYAHDDLIGRRVVGVVNLGTRRIAGFDSAFLLLGAVRDDGRVVLLEVAEDAPLGTPIA